MILHMIWLGEMQPGAAAAIAHNRAMCGNGDKFMLHADLTQLNPRYESAYLRYAKAPQTKSDLLRQSVLEEFGGLYLDCDVRLCVSPSELVRQAGWDRYSFVATGTIPFWNPDILFCPKPWGGWDAVHDYIANFTWPDSRIPVTTFAYRMLRHLSRTIPEQVMPTIHPEQFPWSVRENGPRALACRNGLKPMGL